MNRTLPAYIGANITEANKVRARLAVPAPPVVRKAPNTGHRFAKDRAPADDGAVVKRATNTGRALARYAAAILPSLLGLAFLVVIAGLAAGWLAEVAS